MKEVPLPLGLRTVGLCLALAVPGVAAASDLPSLRLAWIDPAGTAPDLQQAAIAEASALLGEMGVASAWQELKAGDDLESIDVIVVMSGRRSGRNPRGTVMGAVRYQSGEASRGAWVSVPEVAGTLGLDARPGSWWPQQRQALARAIGRVAAHEIVHALAPEREHAASGLMSAALGRGELTRAQIAVDPLTRSVVRDAVAQREQPRRPTPSFAACACPTNDAVM